MFLISKSYQNFLQYCKNYRVSRYRCQLRIFSLAKDGKVEYDTIRMFYLGRNLP